MKIGKWLLVILVACLLVVGCDSSENKNHQESIKIDKSSPDKDIETLRYTVTVMKDIEGGLMDSQNELTADSIPVSYAKSGTETL
jgi:uncharacterized protein YcfL